MLYVDELLMTWKYVEKLEFIENNLEYKSQMSRLGMLSLYIGIEFVYLNEGYFLLQEITHWPC